MVARKKQYLTSCNKPRYNKIVTSPDSTAVKFFARNCLRSIYTIRFVVYVSYPDVCYRINTRKNVKCNFKFLHQQMSKGIASALVFIRQNHNLIPQIVSCRWAFTRKTDGCTLMILLNSLTFSRSAVSTTDFLQSEIFLREERIQCATICVSHKQFLAKNFAVVDLG